MRQKPNYIISLIVHNIENILVSEWDNWDVIKCIVFEYYWLGSNEHCAYLLLCTCNSLLFFAFVQYYWLGSNEHFAYLLLCTCNSLLFFAFVRLVCGTKSEIHRSAGSYPGNCQWFLDYVMAEQRQGHCHGVQRNRMWKGILNVFIPHFFVSLHFSG